MSMQNQSIKEFAAALSSKAAVPGGGGASALCGALAAALGNMVGNLTVGKARYADNESALLVLMEKAEALRLQLLKLIDEDAEAFAPLAAAYSIPKDAPGRDETMEQCLQTAAEAPMRIMELCCQVIGLQEDFARLGSKLAVSDAGTGAALARGAMEGAALNVRINTKSMKNRERAEAMNCRVEQLLREYGKRAELIYVAVTDMLK